MKLPTPDKLDELLSEHLTTTLEPQRGRAAAAFRAQLHAEAKAPTNVRPAIVQGGVIARRALWFWTGVPSLLAACLAVVITLQFARPTQVAKSIDKPGSVIATVDPVKDPGALKFEDLNQVELTRDQNAGIAILDDNTPARVIRRQSVRHTQWQDPNDHATYTLTEPVEDVGYVKVQPY